MKSSSITQKTVIILLGLCFLAMLGVSLNHRFTNPGLVVSNIQAPAQDPDVMNTIGALMQYVAKNPGDQNALLHLAENLMALGQWETAENFIQKVLALNKEGAGHYKAMYLMAVIHHNLNRNDQAAELLEKLLEKDDNPSARYSLGILYAHFLNRPQDGKREFQKGIASEKASPKLKAAMMEELNALSEKPAAQ